MDLSNGISVSFGANISNFKAGIAQMSSDMIAFSARASSVASGVASTLGAAFSRVSSSASSVGTYFANLGTTLTNLNSRLTPFHSAWQNITSALGSAGSAVQGTWSKITGFTSGLVNHVAQLGQTVFWTKQLADSGIQLVGSLFNQNAAMEQTRIGFVGLLGSGEKADAMLKELQNFAAATPFEFPELATDAQMLVGMGFAAKSVIPIMTSVGDAVAGVGAGATGVETVTRVLGQMSAAGKVNAGDMMQITTLGIPAWKILADSMHITVAQAMELSSKGLIPAKVGIDALVNGMEKMYGGQMAGQAQTFNGIISTLHDNLSMAFQTFLTPAFNMAKSGLMVLADIVSSPAFGQFAKTMGDDLSNALKSVANFIAPLVPVVKNLVIQFFAAGGGAQQLGNFILINLIVPFQRLFLVIAPLIVKFAQWLVTSGTLIAMLKLFGGAVAGIIVGVATLATGLALVIDWFSRGSIPAQLLGTALLAIGVYIGLIQLGTLIAMVPILVAGFVAWAAAAWTAAAGTIAATWPLLALAAVIVGVIVVIRNWGAIVTWLITLWTPVAGFFTNIWNSIKQVFSSSISFITSTSISAFNGTIAAIESVWGGIGAFFVNLWAHVSSAFTSSINAIKTNAVGVFNGVVAAIEAAWNGVGAFFTNLWNSVNASTHGQLGQWAAFIAEIFQATFNIIVAIWGKLQVALIAIWSSIFSSIGAFLTNIYTAVSTQFQRTATFIGNIWTSVNTTTSQMWANIFSSISTFLGNIYTAISTKTSQAASWIGQQWNTISSTTASAWGTVSTITSNSWSQISSVIQQKAQQAWTFVVQAWNAINSSTSTMWSQIFGTVGNFLNQIFQRVSSVGTQIKTAFLGVWSSIASSIGGVIRSMANSAISVLNSFLGGLQTFVNALANGLNSIASAVGAASNVHAPGIGRITPLAKGTSHFAGGTALVGEEGPELVILPHGAMVATAPVTKALLHSGIAGKVPGFATGLGDVLGWIGGGLSAVGNFASSAFAVTKDTASSVLSHVFSSTLSMAGPLSGMASAVGTMIKNWGIDMVMKLLGTIKAVPPVTGGSGGALFSGTGSVADWITQALNITGASQSWLGPLTLIAMHESGGNPNSINLWDSNYLAGHPSKGLMQTIDSTFNAYAMAGHGNIYNPVDNAIAAIRYIESRYGGVYNVPGVVNMMHGGPYVGYANGGVISEQIIGRGLSTGRNYRFGENGPETVTPGIAREKGPTTINLIVDGRMMAHALGSHIIEEIRLVTGKGGV